jgi:hypothetical protein
MDSSKKDEYSNNSSIENVNNINLPIDLSKVFEIQPICSINSLNSYDISKIKNFKPRNSHFSLLEEEEKKAFPYKNASEFCANLGFNTELGNALLNTLADMINPINVDFVNVKQYVQKAKNEHPSSPLPVNSIPYTLVNHVVNTINNKQKPISTSELDINPTKYIENLKTNLSKIPNPLVIKSEPVKPTTVSNKQTIPKKVETYNKKNNNKNKIKETKFSQQLALKSSQSQGSFIDVLSNENSVSSKKDISPQVSSQVSTPIKSVKSADFTFKDDTPESVKTCYKLFQKIVKENNVISSGEEYSETLIYFDTNNLISDSTLTKINYYIQKINENHHLGLLIEALDDTDLLGSMLKICENRINDCETMKIDLFPKLFSNSHDEKPSKKQKAEKKSVVVDNDSVDIQKINKEFNYIFGRLLCSFDACIFGFSIMCGGVSEEAMGKGFEKLSKKYYSEEFISATFNLIKFALSELIYPTIELFSISNETVNTSQRLKLLKKEVLKPAIKKNIIYISTRISNLMNSMNKLITTESLNDMVLITICYTSLGPFFVDSLANTDVTFGLKTIQMESMNLLITMFIKFPRNRSLILNECLSNILKTKLKSGKSNNLFKIENGESIQMISALIMQLIQSCSQNDELKTLAEEAIQKFNKLGKIYKKQKRIDEIQQSSGDSTKKKDNSINEKFISEFITIFEELNNKTKEINDQINKYVQQILGYLINRSFYAETVSNTASPNKRRLSKLDSSNEIEYRNFLNNFLNDVLEVLDRPEWPSASIILVTFCKLIIQVEEKKNVVDVKTTIISYYGQILGKLRKRISILNNYPNRAVVKSIKNIKSIIKNNDEIIKQSLLCYWNSQLLILEWLNERVSEDKFCVHSKYFNIMNWCNSLIPQLISFLNDGRSNFHFSEIIRLCRKILIEYCKYFTLSEKSSTIPVLDIFEYVDDEDADITSNIIEDVPKENTENDTSKKYDNIQVMKNIIKKQFNSPLDLIPISILLSSNEPIYQMYDVLFQRIVFLLDSVHVSVRSKVLRSIQIIVNVDCEVLMQPQIASTVVHCIQDSSAVVRDAAIELIGKYLINSDSALNFSEITKQYYKVVTDRILDIGINVRKRVIKLLKDIYINTKYEDYISNKEMLKDICRKILKRTTDEEKSVKELALKSIQEIWFSSFFSPELTAVENLKNNLSSLSTLSTSNSNSSMVHINSMIDGANGFSKETLDDKEEKIKDMIPSYTSLTTQTKNEIKYRVEMLSVMADSDITGNTINKCISSKYNLNIGVVDDEKQNTTTNNKNKSNTENSNAAAKAAALNENKIKFPIPTLLVYGISNLIVECLVDQLIDLEGDDSPEAKKNPKAINEKINNCLNLLYQFSRAKPELLANHIVTLQPYFHPSSNQSAMDKNILRSIIMIYKNSLRYAKNYDPNVLKQVEQDLEFMIHRQGTAIVQAAIPCLCTIIENVTFNYNRTLNLLKCCLDFLKDKYDAMVKAKNFKINQVAGYIRSFIISGMVIRESNFDKIPEKRKKNISPQYKYLIEKDYIKTIYQILMNYLNEGFSPIIRRCALENIGHIFIVYPRLMLNQTSIKLMNEIFKNNDIALKINLLNIYFDYLRIDHKDDKKEEEEEKANKKEKKDIDVKLLVGITDEIVDMGISSALMQQFLSEILECLFTNDINLKTASFDVLYVILEQGLVHPLKCIPYVVAFETCTEKNLRDRAIKLHKSLTEKHASFIHSKNSICVNKTYEYQLMLFNNDEKKIKGYRVYNKEYVEALLTPMFNIIRDKRNKRNEFLTNLVKSCDQREKTFNRYYSRYIIENLATLEYKTQEEILLVIYRIQPILAEQGQTLLEFIDQWDEKKKSYTVLSEKELKQLDDYTKIAFTSGLLQLLRNHLKWLYGITELRCINFKPNKVTKTSEKQVNRLYQLNMFSYSSIPPFEYDSKNQHQMISIIKKIISLYKHDLPSANEFKENDSAL